MDNQIIYLGIIIMAAGIFTFFRHFLIYRKGDTVEAEVLYCKNKTSSKSGSRCYPKVSVQQDDGTEVEFYCYSAKRRGHNKYYEGELLTLYRHKKLLGGTGYLHKVAMSGNIISMLGIGLALIIISFIS